MTSRVGAVARLLFIDLAGSIAWFPVWWYTKGLVKVVHSVQSALTFRVQSYGFRIWIRNFFVPMYGQHDWVGRIVSVFMRFVVLVARSIAIVVEAIIYGFGILLWAAAPVIFILFGLSSFVRGATGTL